MMKLVFLVAVLFSQFGFANNADLKKPIQCLASLVLAAQNLDDYEGTSHVISRTITLNPTSLGGHEGSVQFIFGSATVTTELSIYGDASAPGLLQIINSTTVDGKRGDIFENFLLKATGPSSGYGWDFAPEGKNQFTVLVNGTLDDTKLLRWDLLSAPWKALSQNGKYRVHSRHGYDLGIAEKISQAVADKVLYEGQPILVGINGCYQ